MFLAEHAMAKAGSKKAATDSTLVNSYNKKYLSCTKNCIKSRYSYCGCRFK